MTTCAFSPPPPLRRRSRSWSDCPDTTLYPAGPRTFSFAPMHWPRRARSTPDSSGPRTGTCGSGWRERGHRRSSLDHWSPTGSIRRTSQRRRRRSSRRPTGSPHGTASPSIGPRCSAERPGSPFARTTAAGRSVTTREQLRWEMSGRRQGPRWRWCIRRSARIACSALLPRVAVGRRAAARGAGMARRSVAPRGRNAVAVRERHACGRRRQAPGSDVSSRGTDRRRGSRHCSVRRPEPGTRLPPCDGGGAA